MSSSGSVLSVASPTAVCRDFAAVIAAGDLDAIRVHLARHCALVTPDATTVRGRDDATAVIGQLSASDPEIVVESSSLLEAADVALVRQCWRITVKPTFRRPLSRHFETTVVLRRIEGVWKLMLVAPWGLGAREGRVDQIEGSQP